MIRLAENRPAETQGGKAPFAIELREQQRNPSDIGDRAPPTPRSRLSEVGERANGSQVPFCHSGNIFLLWNGCARRGVRGCPVRCPSSALLPARSV